MEGQRKIDLESAKAEFSALVQAWKETWPSIGKLENTTPPLHPRKIPERLIPHYSAEQIESEKPGQEIYLKMIDAAINILKLCADSKENTRSVLVELETKFGLTGFQEGYWAEFLQEIFIRQAEMAHAKPEVQGATEVDALRGTFNGQLQQMSFAQLTAANKEANEAARISFSETESDGRLSYKNALGDSIEIVYRRDRFTFSYISTGLKRVHEYVMSNFSSANHLGTSKDEMKANIGKMFADLGYRIIQ